MGKQKKQTLILLACLLLLLAGYFGLQAYNRYGADREKEKEKAQEIVITDYKQEDILSLTYDYEGQKHTFERQGETWTYPAEPSLDIDEGSLDGMAERVASAAATDRIENVTDLSQYGLDTPFKTISFATAEQSGTFYLGDYNALVGAYYLYADGDASTVYTVNANLYNAFSKDLESLIAKEDVSGGDAVASGGDAGVSGPSGEENPSGQ